VNTNADSGTGSLRQAITDATSGDTIQFQFATTPVTISLTSGDLQIDKNLTITGLGAANLIIDASSNSGGRRVFTIGSGVTVSISALTVKNGQGHSSALGSIGGDGGGIYNLGNLTLTNVVVSNNTATNSGTGAGGGGIYNNGTLALVGSTVSNNTAGSKTSVGANFVTGGAIRNSNGTLTVTDSTISNNFAQIGGGIFDTGSMTVTGSTFASNSAGVGIVTTTTLEGGAIFINAQGSGAIVNSTFSGNSAHDNGGAIANNGTVSVSFSTFSANSAPNGNSVSATHNTLTLKADIFSNSTNCLISGGSIVSDGHNLATDSSCNLNATGDLPNTAPGLDPSGLQNNSGSTQTIALLSSSAAVDTIPTPCTNASGNSVSIDQRGVTRPQGTNCDIGAFELQPSSGTTVTNVNDSGNGSLRQAIANAQAGDTIDFNLSYPATITLTTQILAGTDLRIDKNLTIRGPGASNLTVSGNGGAQIFFITSGVTASISGLTLDNGKNDNGGAVGNNGTLNISDCVVSGSSSVQGAGINNQSTGVLNISNSSISNNTASGIGGGIFNAGTATITGGTLSGNIAAEAGGIFSSGPLTIVNSTFWGNRGNTAVGAIENTSTLHLSNSTLSNNSSISIGGIFNNQGTTTIKGTLLAKASVGNNCAVNTGSIVSQAYNLSDDTSCNSGFSDPTDLNNTPAGLSSGGLQDSGGPTQTVALLANSAAFDAIPTASCTDVDGNTLTTDQRGITRPQQAGCDIGAYELALGAPTITSFTPSSGVAGTSVTITGTGFTAASTVAFNNTSAATTTVNSDTQITATAPSGVTTGPISVTTIAGTGTSSTNFTVVQQPTITGFNPTSGTAGTVVIITGTAFTGATSVTFNGTSSTFTISSDTQISGTAPPGASTGPIAVTTGGGTGQSGTNFTVIPVPTITGFSPTSGGIGAVVTISGTAFTGATSVTFNGTSSTFTISSDTQITATVPSGATTGSIAVTTGGGTAQSGTNFTVVAHLPPTITGFTPASGSVGTSVTISGANLKGATSVTFNGTSASFKFSGMKIIATVPAGATSGPITVTTPGGLATSGTSFAVIAAPAIANFTPANGPVGTQVTISGTNFTTATSVMFGSKTAVFTVVDAQTITAIVPKGAKSGPISVTTPGGKATSGSSFIVN
jgi:hypothetical protein